MESTIGQRIKQLREAKQLSVTAFAKAAGVKASAIYGLESDANKPSIETVGNLRESFPDLNTEWLQFGVGAMYKEAELTPLGQLPPPVPSEAKPTQPGSGEGGLFISPKSAAEEIGYWRNKYEQEHAAHERTRNQGHERETLLIKRIGGKTEASADAADPTHTASMAVSFVNPDQVAAQAFLRRRAAAYAPAADNSWPVRVRGFVASLR